MRRDDEEVALLSVPGAGMETDMRGTRLLRVFCDDGGVDGARGRFGRRTDGQELAGVRTLSPLGLPVSVSALTALGQCAQWQMADQTEQASDGTLGSRPWYFSLIFLWLQILLAWQVRQAGRAGRPPRARAGGSRWARELDGRWDGTAGNPMSWGTHTQRGGGEGRAREIRTALPGPVLTLNTAGRSCATNEGGQRINSVGG